MPITFGKALDLLYDSKLEEIAKRTTSSESIKREIEVGFDLGRGILEDEDQPEEYRPYLMVNFADSQRSKVEEPQARIVRATYHGNKSYFGLEIYLETAEAIVFGEVTGIHKDQESQDKFETLLKEYGLELIAV